MTMPTVYNSTVRKAYALLFLLFMAKHTFAQKDSLMQHSKKIELGMTKSTVNSLMPYDVGNMQWAGGGPWRYIYDSTYQSVTEYHDKEWKKYSFRMLYQMDRLMYIDLYDHTSQKILYSLKDSAKANQLVARFNKQYNAQGKFSSMVTSFSTKVYDLD